jgi:hypothetical protein
MIKNLTGQIFGRLTVLRCIGRDKWGSAIWLCHCVCGTEVPVVRTELTSGDTQSCGCIHRSELAARNRAECGINSPCFKHGHCLGGHSSPERTVWSDMIQRCTNPNNHCWPFYGARGVTVCDRWLGENGFRNFLADMGLRSSPKHSLSRFLDSGNYEPGNVEWAIQAQQTAEHYGKKAMQALHVERQLEFLRVAA